jgi:hypothetical protein
MREELKPVAWVASARRDLKTFSNRMLRKAYRKNDMRKRSTPWVRKLAASFIFSPYWERKSEGAGC